MNTRPYRSAGWATILSGLLSIATLLTLILFFWLEAGSKEVHLWGPLSDICPIIQMVLLLVVARAVHRIQQLRAPGLSLTAAIVGAAGMLGVILLQALLRLQIIQFAQEVGPLTTVTGLVGVWLILVNYLGRRQANLPSPLAWLGMAVGAAFVLEPVVLFAAGGAEYWRAFMSNYLLLAAGAIVFLVVYIGFPIWAIWLGRVLLTASPGEGTLPSRRLFLDRGAS